MPDEAQQPTAIANAISLKLPDFWPSDPELWFAQAEALFDAQNITQEKTKFAHMVRVLLAQYASEVRDIILRSPEAPYTALKTELKQRVCPSKRQRLQQLLHVESCDDRKPSQLLRQMLKLRGGTVPDVDKDEIFRELFLQKLSITVRTALEIHKDVSLTQLADKADNMAEVQGPQAPVYQLQADVQGRQPHLYQLPPQGNPEITAIQTELQKIWKTLQSQPRSAQEQQRSPSQPAICWYHERFGAKVLKCREPCKFQQPSGKLDGQSVNAAQATGKSCLLRLFDKNTKQNFLIDTGAEISVFPAGRSDRLHKTDVTLRAANNSIISTYGFRRFTLDFGLPRPLTRRFLVVDVTQPIIGADFLLQHKLLVDLDQRRLIDTRNGTRVEADPSPCSTPRLNFISTSPPTGDPFKRLLEDFPSLTTPCTSDTPVQHGVSHHIVTDGRPVFARPRRLSPEKLIAAKSRVQQTP